MKLEVIRNQCNVCTQLSNLPVFSNLSLFRTRVLLYVHIFIERRFLAISFPFFTDNASIKLKASEDNSLSSRLFARKFLEKLNYTAFIVHSEPSRAAVIVSGRSEIYFPRGRERKEVEASAFHGLITTRAAAGSRRPLKGRTVIPCNGRAGTIRYNISTVFKTNSFVFSSTTLLLRRRALDRARHRIHIKTPGVI